MNLDGIQYGITLLIFGGSVGAAFGSLAIGLAMASTLLLVLMTLALWANTKR